MKQHFFIDNHPLWCVCMQCEIKQPTYTKLLQFTESDSLVSTFADKVKEALQNRPTFMSHYSNEDTEHLNQTTCSEEH